jgi:hypothetical protein
LQLTFYTKIRGKDLQELVFDKIYNKWQKTSMLILGFLSAIYIFYLIRDFIGNEINLVFLNRQILKITVLIMMFYSLYIPFYIRYRPLKDNFDKRKIIDKLVKYNFNENGIRIYIFEDTKFIKWDDIIKVEELKTGFIIYSSIDSDIFIPRNAFISQTQINIFYNIIKKYMSKERIRLLNYGISKNIKSEKFIYKIDDEQIVFDSKLNIIDIFKYNLFIFLTAKLGIIINTITLIFIVNGIFEYLKENNLNYLIFGLFLLGINFVIILVRSLYIFIKNDLIRGCFTYSINFNSLKVSKNSEYIEIHYNNINYVKEYFGNLIIILRSGQTYIIPKRIFNKSRENLYIVKKIFMICINNQL